MSLFGFTPTAHSATPAADTTKNVYAYSFKELNTNAPLPLAQFKGKVLLVVNTASMCGFTKQYKGLEDLYNTYKDQGLVVLGVPSADFGNQEYGEDAKIKSFCELNYGVSFPMAHKETVKGDQAHPFYKAAYDRFGFLGAPKWNFHKYLISKDGHFVDYYYSTTKPMSSKIQRAIKKELQK